VISDLVEVLAEEGTNTKATETQVTEPWTADVLAIMSAVTASGPLLEDAEPDAAGAFQGTIARGRR
jgi:hypothetical protein